jgi:hypothetical protein
VLPALMGVSGVDLQIANRVCEDQVQEAIGDMQM